MVRRKVRSDASERVDVRMDDDPDEAPPAVPDPRRRRILLVGAVLVVLGIVTATLLTNAAERRDDAERRAASADVPGVLDPLDEPLRELWRAGDGEYPVAFTDDAVALASPDVALEVRDALTGDVRWHRVGVPDESCAPLAATTTPVLFGPVVPTRADDVVCWVASDIVQAEGPLVVPPTEVVVLDIASGAEVGAFEMTQTMVGIEVLDDSVLVASADRAGAVHVRRWSPRDGEVWAVDAGPGVLGQIQDQGLVFGRLGGVFWLGGLDAPARSVATGEALADPGPAPDLIGSGGIGLPDGGWASWTTLDRPGEVRGDVLTRVTDADGRLRFTVAGQPWVGPGVAYGPTASMTSDGAPPGLLLMRLDAGLGDSGRVAGLDAGTGEVLWEGDRLAGVAPLVRLGGVLVAVGAGQVHGFDLTTGRELWRSSALGTPVGAAVTDGERVVLPTTVADGPALTSFDIDTGATGWSVVLRERPTGLWALGGRSVLMLTPTSVVVLG